MPERLARLSRGTRRPPWRTVQFPAGVEDLSGRAADKVAAGNAVTTAAACLLNAFDIVTPRWAECWVDWRRGTFQDRPSGGSGAYNIFRVPPQTGLGGKRLNVRTANGNGTGFTQEQFVLRRFPSAGC